MRNGQLNADEVRCRQRQLYNFKQISRSSDRYETVILNSTVWPTVTGVPGAGDADSSLIEYPFAEPFTKDHGMGRSAALGEYAKARSAMYKTRIAISPLPLSQAAAPGTPFPAFNLFPQCGHTHSPNSACDLARGTRRNHIGVRQLEQCPDS